VLYTLSLHDALPIFFDRIQGPVCSLAIELETLEAFCNVACDRFLTFVRQRKACDRLRTREYRIQGLSIFMTGKTEYEAAVARVAHFAKDEDTIHKQLDKILESQAFRGSRRSQSWLL